MCSHIAACGLLLWMWPVSFVILHICVPAGTWTLTNTDENKVLQTSKGVFMYYCYWQFYSVYKVIVQNPHSEKHCQGNALTQLLEWISSACSCNLIQLTHTNGLKTQLCHADGLLTIAWIKQKILQSLDFQKDSADLHHSYWILVLPSSCSIKSTACSEIIAETGNE